MPRAPFVVTAVFVAAALSRAVALAAEPEPFATSSAAILAVSYLVFANIGATGGSVELTVTISDPVCGNDLIEFNANEQCDDGNPTAGDGCSDTCQIEPLGTVSGPPGTQSFTGNIAGLQILYYEITVTAESYIDAEIFSPTSGVCGSNTPL